ncbi:MAG: hypothetical protein EXS44_03125 [Candidatus Levybacteria bacterium]|nr:hypothetical protein [Candidatus Levybacteria bacterium]
MQKKSRFLLTFLFCFFIALIILFSQKTGIILGFRYFGEVLFSPIQRIIYNVSIGFPWIASDKKTDILIKKNQIQQLSLDYQEILKENQALKDQFEVGKVFESKLLPSRILGAPRFLPGFIPDTFIIDNGEKSGVKVGQGVVVKNQVIGKITKVSKTYSIVTLVTNTSFSIPVKTAKTGALGILKGIGNGQMLLDNVLLSEEIIIGDEIEVYGDIDKDGNGLMPNMLIGKIVSIDKNPSALFQKANIIVLTALEKLSIVFVMLGEK